MWVKHELALVLAHCDSSIVLGPEICGRRQGAGDMHQPCPSRECLYALLSLIPPCPCTPPTPATVHSPTQQGKCVKSGDTFELEAAILKSGADSDRAMAAATPAEPNAEPTVDLAHQPSGSESPVGSGEGAEEGSEPAAKRSRR
jgi:hypothetical protein